MTMITCDHLEASEKGSTDCEFIFSVKSDC